MQDIARVPRQQRAVRPAADDPVRLKSVCLLKPRDGLHRRGAEYSVRLQRPIARAVQPQLQKLH